MNFNRKQGVAFFGSVNDSDPLHNCIHNVIIVTIVFIVKKKKNLSYIHILDGKINIFIFF